jgi:uncharacterized protein (DUF1697 family)
MKELVSALEKLGLTDVNTYIQSGNAVFRSKGKKADRLADRIARTIQTSHGFTPQVLVLSLEAFRAAARTCPFPPADADAKTVHLFFLAEPANDPDLEALNAVKAGTEEYVLTEEVFYLHAPDGIGRSRLAERVERSLGVPATARNWRSVTRILALAERIHSP